MSLGRWTATTTAMAVTAWALVLLGPDAPQVRQAATDPQALVDSVGPDALLVVVAAAAGWLCWAWGALGLALTALSALPGAAGATADSLLVALLPAGARRLAAVALGLTLATGGPALVSVPAALPIPGAAALTTAAAEQPVGSGAGSPGVAGGTAGAADGAPGIPPDWPAAPGARPPDARPAGAPPPGAAPTAGDHVVLRGDCLWHIAAGWLAVQRPDTPVRNADTLAAVSAWWQTNAAVIGPDPDVLLPGQVLSAPPLPVAAPPSAPPPSVPPSAPPP